MVDPSHYSGIDGFLGTRASLMLDVVFLAMFAVLPVLAWSVYQVKYHRRYLLHKRVQLTLGVVLLVTVALFETDMRINGWRDRAEASRFWDQAGTNWVDVALAIHLCFAVTTALAWIVVIARALANFPSPPVPGPHSPWHRRWAKVAALDMLFTALTGWLFYWLAFVA
jgi:putative membrane protein